MKHILKFLLPMAAIALLAVSCGGSKYSYETVKGDPLNARIYTLDNGLKVYMAVNKETPRIQANIAVRVGAKNDPAETTGLAHYFEHLMFKGTQQFGTQDYAAEKPILDQIEAQFEIYRRTTDEAERTRIYGVIDSLSYEASKLAIPNEYDKLMSAIGAQGTNAYTGYDMTVYVENIPSNQVENWAMIQSDRFKNAVIRGFHTELETVYEEKNMSLTSDSRKVIEATFTGLYPNHPYGTQTVLGTQEHLKNPSITMIKDYYRKWYVPNNMAVCLSGDFDPETMIATIDKYFGDMQPNPELTPLQIKPETPITTPIIKEVLGLEAENVTLAWRCAGTSDPQANKLAIMSSLLYNGSAGLMDIDLIQQQQILSGWATYYDQADHGAFLMQARPKTGQTLDQVRDLLLVQVAKLKAGDFDQTLITATVNNYKAALMNQYDSNNGRVGALVDAFINNLSWETEVNMLKDMGTITKEEIVALANEVFADNSYVITYKRQGQDPSENKISKPQITPIETNRDKQSAFLTAVQNTEVKPLEPVFLDFNKDLGRAKAKSDTEVLFVKNPSNELFTLNYVYETGSNNDPALGTAFGYLDFLGTSDLTAEQIKQEFFNIACNFSVSPGAERSFITVGGLSENMGRAIELLESLLADAQPNREALNNMIADQLQGRQNAKLNQDQNFSRLLSFATYGPKSPATNVLSTQQLRSLTPEDLLSKIRSFRDMEHRILYYGPLEGNALVEALNQSHYIAEQPVSPPPTIVYKALETPENRVLIAHYDAKQIYYYQYSNRGEMFDPTLDPVITLYNNYFGGGMNSIVFQEMREARGLAYSSAASLSIPSKKERPYTYGAFIATQNDKMVDAVEAFEDIINNMPESQAAFDLAKESMIAGYRSNRIIKSAIMQTYLSALDMGIDYDRRKNNYEALQTMTLEDVKNFQQKWVKDRNYTFCILGDEKDLDMASMRQYGPVTRVSQEQLFGY